MIVMSFQLRHVPWPALGKEIDSENVKSDRSEIRAILLLALTDTSVLYNTEIRLSLRVSTPVELAHLPSHWRKLIGT